MLAPIDRTMFSMPLHLLEGPDRRERDGEQRQADHDEDHVVH
jgi:hypothetical protein